jgi:hypothetical protein
MVALCQTVVDGNVPPINIARSGPSRNTGVRCSKATADAAVEEPITGIAALLRALRERAVRPLITSRVFVEAPPPALLHNCSRNGRSRSGRRVRRSMLALLGSAQIWAIGAMSVPVAEPAAFARRIAMDMEIKRSGAEPSRKGPAEWFTGTVRIDPLFQAPGPRASAARW